MIIPLHGNMRLPVLLRSYTPDVNPSYPVLKVEKLTFPETYFAIYRI